VFLTNPDKTEFAVVDAGDPVGELRSFTWSADGKQLAIVGNAMGSGNIYRTDPGGTLPEPVLPMGEAGYLLDASWSWDGEQLVAWSSQNNSVVYFVQADGSGMVSKPLGMQVISTPRFSPNDQSIVFHGANSDAFGLFEVQLDDLQVRRISAQVEDETGFAFSPDGSHLAYMEIDRNAGEARLMAEGVATDSEVVLGTLPISTGSGSSIPETANLSWSADGKFVVFDFGGSPGLRSIYLAHADGSGMTEVVKGYAPSISADGKCLAYISNKQVFLLDMSTVSVDPATAVPVLLADLPTGRGTPNFKQDRLLWKP
jgi:Tol biopolymer transport system component